MATGAATFLRSTPLGIAVAYGVAYGGAVTMLGHISGGHFNPAVTVAHWVTHRFGTFESLLYIGAQLAGASAAAYALRFAWLATTTASTALLGPPVLAAGVTRGPALLVEAAGTFALVLALWATIVGRARPRYWLGGIVAGAVVAVASHLGAPYTGGVLESGARVRAGARRAAMGLPGRVLGRAAGRRGCCRIALRSAVSPPFSSCPGGAKDHCLTLRQLTSRYQHETLALAALVGTQPGC